jgi:HK97 family phage major capsid protein
MSAVTAVAPAPSAEAKQMVQEMLKAATLEAAAERGIVGVGASNVIDIKSWQPGKTKGRLPPLTHLDAENESDPLKGKGIRAAQVFKVAIYAAKNGIPMARAAEYYFAKGNLDAFVHKAIVEGTLQDGGPLVPPQFAAEFIPLLRAATVLLKSGIKAVPMESDQLIYARQNAPAVAYYVGEVFAVTYSQLKTGNLKLATKKVKAITAVSDEMLRDGGSAADNMIRDDLVKVLALRMDLAGLRGDGTQETPLGLRYGAAATSIFAATQAGTAATFQEIANDIEKMERLIDEANVTVDKLAWYMAPRSKHYLKSLASTSGVFPFREEVRAGTLNGWPIFTSTQIPTTLGAGSESEVYLLATQEYLFGEKDELLIQAFPGGTFQDASGSLVSGITTGQVPVAGEMRHDFALRYTAAVSVLTTVKWGV